MYHLLNLAAFMHAIGASPAAYWRYTTDHVHVCDLRYALTRMNSALARSRRRAKCNCDDIPF